MNRTLIRRVQRPAPVLSRALVLAITLLLMTSLTGLMHGIGAAAPTIDTRVSAAPAEPAATAGSSIFSDDFEAYGDSTLWSGQYSFPVQSNEVANGSFAALLNNRGGNPVFGRKSFDNAYTRLYVRTRFNILEQASTPVGLLNLRSTATSSVISIHVDASGQLFYQTGATDVTSASTSSITDGAWHELQVMVDVSSQTSNVRIWLDNAELTSLREQVWLGDRGIRILELGNNSAGQDSDVAYDDVVVDDEFIASDRQADPISGSIVVNTYPAWEGIPFELDGRIFYSKDDGSVEIQVARWSTDLRSRIKVHDTNRPDGSLAVFTGWKHWYSVHSHDVYAAFRISEPVQFSFEDGGGQPVDPSIIDKLTLKSSSGDLLEFTGSQLSKEVLIPVLGTAFGPTGIKTRVTSYVIDEVMIDGSNAVHRSQQRSSFDSTETPQTTRTWTVPLLFYSVTFRAKDAFFGSGLGKSIVVQSADGTEFEVPLNEAGEATIPRLSRGEYSVSVIGAGYSPPRPIYVSRDQEIEMKVITLFDVASLLLVVGTVVVTLMLIGRPYLVTTPYRLVKRGIRATPRIVGREMRPWRWEGRR
jgi:hypothetical protein